MRIAEHILAARVPARGTRRTDDAPHLDGLPTVTGVHLRRVAGSEAEGIGGVAFDQNSVGFVGTEVGAADKVNGIDRGPGAGRQPDDPAEQLRAPDLHRWST